MDNIILACRQQDSQKVYANGDYRTVLAEPIQIVEGDQIYLNKLFLDDRDNNNNIITLDSDEVLEFRYILYNKNWVTPKDKVHMYGPDTETFTHIDNGTYTVCKQYTMPYGVDYFIISSLTLLKNSNKSTINKVTLEINYDTITGKSGSLNYDIDLSKVIIGTNEIVNIDFPVIYTTNILSVTLSEESKNNLYSYGYTFSKFNDVRNTAPGIDEPPLVVYEPVEITTQVTLPAGKYTPIQLAEKLSQICGSIEATENYSVNGPFLFTDDAFSAPDNVTYVRSPNLSQTLTPYDIYYYKTPSKAFTGSNQISFNYDSVSNKFFIDYIHFPMYSANGAIGISTKEGLSYDSAPTGFFFEVASNSGIAFTQIPNFLVDVMGFDRNSMQITYNFISIKPTPIPIGSANNSPPLYIPYLNYNASTNITEGFIGLDNLVIKSATFYEADIKDGNFTTTDTTIPIYATNPLDPVILSNAYIVAEINANFKQSYIGEETTKKNIGAIVGQYYSAGGYTTGNASDSFQYTHVGEPIYLNSFGIRLLNPDFTLIEDLGEDNSVFIQVVKSKIPQQQQQQQQQQTEKKNTKN